MQRVVRRSHTRQTMLEWERPQKSNGSVIAKHPRHGNLIISFSEFGRQCVEGGREGGVGSCCHGLFAPVQ